MRALIVRWLGHRLDERVACEIRNTRRATKAAEFYNERYRAMRRDRDKLLADLTATRIELANLRAQRGVVSR